MNSYYPLSQGDLHLLEICPPQFEKIYWHKQPEPRHLKYQEKAQWGKSFHLLMQQYNLGLNIENLSIAHPELVHQAQALIAKTQNIWQAPEIIFRQAEYQVNYTIENFIFTVIYDLLVFFPDQAIIMDWKTYREPQNKEKIINNWQTKLYLYVLAEKFNYTPEQISFDYWFVTSAAKIEQYSIAYSTSFHEQIKQELNTLLNKFKLLVNNFYGQNISFPHADNCEQCPYHDSFQEDKKKESNIPIFTSFDEIEMINL
jgi:hypothetical protein